MPDGFKDFLKTQARAGHSDSTTAVCTVMLYTDIGSICLLLQDIDDTLTHGVFGTSGKRHRAGCSDNGLAGDTTIQLHRDHARAV
jgi:hypothetical protein